MFKGIFLLLSTVTCLPGAIAAKYESKGLPCAAGVCVGAGLDSLAGITWHPAKDKEGRPSARPDRNASREFGSDKAKEVYRGDLGDALPYLVDGSFDRSALPALGKVVAACNISYLKGTFTTRLGRPATVSVMLAPVPGNPKVQRWLVDGITIHLPDLVTEGQKNEAKRLLELRYAAFNKETRNEGEGYFRAYGTSYDLGLMNGADFEKNLKRATACGGSPDVNLED